MSTPTTRRRGKGRGLDKEAGAPISPVLEKYHRTIDRAYRMSLIGLVPFLGVVLAPLAALVAYSTYRKARLDPGFHFQAYAIAAMIFGVLSCLFNWAGLALMILGWYYG